MANEFKTIRCAKATYDFATHAGAIGAALGLDVSIPSGAIVTRVIGSANTAFTSGGSATVAINIGATEVNAATAFDSADYVAVDVHYSTPVATSGEINIDIATATLTAGNYDVFVEYIY
jgi:hypothetical protein